MTEVRRVSAPGSPFSGRDRAIATVVSFGILVAIIKPWGDGPGTAVATPRPSASPAATPAPVDEAGHGYDQKLFGPFEPAPDWSIWPAGYFVSVRYVTREAVDDPVAPVVEPAASPGDRPFASAAPSPAAPSPAPAGPAWPTEIVVGPGDHLLWLGVNTPLGWTIRDTDLRRTAADGTDEEVPLTRLPSEWDDHFAVLGIPVEPASERLVDWPPGEYRLSITVDPGRVTRTIEISIMTAPEPAAAPPAIIRP
jgi:hypothetical protein